MGERNGRWASSYGLDLWQSPSEEKSLFVYGRISIYGEPGVVQPFIMQLDSNFSLVDTTFYNAYSEFVSPIMTSSMIYHTQSSKLIFISRDTLHLFDPINGEHSNMSLDQYNLKGFESYDLTICDGRIYILGTLQYKKKLIVLNGDLTLRNIVDTEYGWNWMSSIECQNNEFITFLGTTDHKANVAKVSLEGELIWTTTVDHESNSIKSLGGITYTDNEFIGVGPSYNLDSLAYCPIALGLGVNGELKWFSDFGDCDVNNGSNGVLMNRDKPLIVGQRKCTEKWGTDIFVHELVESDKSFVVSVKEKKERETRIDVRPNPTSGVLEFKGDVQQVILLDPFGVKYVFHENIIDIGHLPCGVYGAMVIFRNGKFGNQLIIRSGP